MGGKEGTCGKEEKGQIGINEVPISVGVNFLVDRGSDNFVDRVRGAN